MKISRRKLMEWMGMSGGTALGAQWFGMRDALGARPATELAGATQAAAADATTRWAQVAAQHSEAAKDVTWLTHEPLIYLLRRGDHSDEEAARYDRMVEPENLKRMADAGVKWGRIFFYKGFGLEYEKPHIEKAKRAAETMHALGMKVSVYVAGTMFTETMYREVPEAESWEERDCWNHWIPYGIKTYRHFACHNQPGFREYMKRVMRVGVQDVKADELAFDQISLQPEPRSCRCARCIEAFAAFLRKRYPNRDAAFRRFALPDVDWIRVNQWDGHESLGEGPTELAAIDDPVLQEWTRFRCESLASYARDLYDYAKSLNPNVAVSYNMKGMYSFNRYWTYAVYHPLFAGHVDRLSFDTGGYDARIDPETGALVSQIRSYKMARKIGSCSEEADFLVDELRASLYMAFGLQKPVCTGAPWGPGAFNVFTPAMEFFRAHNARYYTETETVTDVAVLRNWPSMAYSVSATWIPTTLMEQILIQYKVPFDLLFDEELDRIGRYRAVILAGQECIGDAQAALLMRYVENGGTLIVSGSAGKYNERREERTKSALPQAGRGGKGQIVAVPEIIRGDLRGDARGARSGATAENPEPGITLRKGAQLSPSQWVLPKNHAEIYEQMLTVIPGGLSIHTEAPLTTVMELYTRASTRETIAHFINFERKSRTAPFAVTVRKQFAGSVKSVTCFTADENEPVDLHFEESGDAVKFTVPPMRVYAMVVVA
jgi:Beta-galactosidase